MRKILNAFIHDENGAAMVEYTVLLGLIVGATILLVLAIAGWVTGSWQALCDTLAANTSVGCTVSGGA